MAVVDYQPDQPQASAVLRNTEQPGIYIKSTKNAARSASGIVKATLLRDGDCIQYETHYEPWEIQLIGNDASAKMCFSDASHLVIRVEGAHASLYLDAMPASPYDYAFELRDPHDKPYYVLNSYRTQSKYYLTARSGKLELIQEENSSCVSKGGASGAASCYFILSCEDTSDAELVVQEIPTNLCAHTMPHKPYGEICTGARDVFEGFLAHFPEAPELYRPAYVEALYTSWSATVAPAGLLQREATWMSNTFFPGIWSWDHCFNVVGFMRGDKQLAFDNMAVMFDFQDAWGQLPGSVNDANIHWNFAKPPIQGLFILKMLGCISLTTQQMEVLFDGLSRQVDFWFTYRDGNNDGIPEYHHGNDSGFDNSTVFGNSFVVDSPDLMAYLICALDALEELGSRLARNTAAYKEFRDLAIQRFLGHFIHEGHLVARDTVTQQVISSRSILPLMSLVIAQYLPEDVVANTVSDLRENFLAPSGLATEQTGSAHYEADGYWRGPVWAPEMVIMIDALANLGEREFAEDLARRFIDTMARNGFAENYDAQTGRALRDPAHTWTSSSFLYLVDTYGYCLNQ